MLEIELKHITVFEGFWLRVGENDDRRPTACPAGHRGDGRWTVDGSQFSLLSADVLIVCSRG